MRTIQDRDLTLFVRLDVINNQHVERILIKTQLRRYLFWPLNHKQIKMFRSIEKSIVIAKFRFKLRHFITRISGHNPVNQRGTKGVRLIQPLHKRSGQAPLLSVTQYQLAQRLAIVINQFTRNDNPAFIKRAVKTGITFKQQPRQLRGVADRGRVIKCVTGMVANTGFCGIRENKTHVRVMRQFQEFIVILIDADFTVNRTDQTRVANRLALFIQTTNNRGIEPVLGTQ